MCCGAETSALEATCFWHLGQSLMGAIGLSLGHVRFLGGLSQAKILISNTFAILLRSSTSCNSRTTTRVQNSICGWPA